MVTASGFTSAPLSRAMIVSLVLSSLLTSTLDIKHHLPIKVTPHLWPWLQFSRTLTFQLAYVSSTELLFAVAVLYQMRVLERLWGRRKFGSFVVVCWVLCGVGIVGVGVGLKVLTWGRWGYIPPGLTGVVVATVSVWSGEVPGLYGMRVLTGLGSSDVRAANGRGGDGDGDDASQTSQGQSQSRSQTRTSSEKGLVLSDKFTTYLLTAQLALSQFPYQLLPALIGWVVGVAWREELLPMGLIRWRVPAWVVGETSDGKTNRGQYEGLRRRLEEEEGGARDGMREVSDGVAMADSNNNNTNNPEQRRGIGRGIMSYFTSSPDR